MRFENVHLEAFGHVLPEQSTTSEELEERLAPIYERLNLSVGRLELMSGIRRRRFFPEGTRPSEPAARAGEAAIERSGIDRSRIGLLIHAAVCRDFLEPATASVVHGRLGLSPSCAAFDLSNACLGFANAMVVVARAIEAGEIRAGPVVAGAVPRPKRPFPAPEPHPSRSLPTPLPPPHLPAPDRAAGPLADPGAARGDGIRGGGGASRGSVKGESAGRRGLVSGGLRPGRPGGLLPRVPHRSGRARLTHPAPLGIGFATRVDGHGTVGVVAEDTGSGASPRGTRRSGPSSTGARAT